MSNVIIKDIPYNEDYLFAKKVTFIDRTPLFLPVTKTIKCVITNIAIYIKIANVLIDLTGTERIRIDEITSLSSKKKHENRKYNKTLKIQDPFHIFTFSLNSQDFDEIVNLITTLNPNIALIYE